LSRIHYGFLLNVPACLEMSLSEASRLYAISRVWQALFGITPVDEAWEVLIAENHLLPSHRHLATSLESARAAINIYYGIGGTDTNAIRSRIKKILEDKPFLYGVKISPFRF
jgi:hypothetical protein